MRLNDLYIHKGLKIYVVSCHVIAINLTLLLNIYLTLNPYFWDKLILNILNLENIGKQNLI